ncbi:MAG: hypothetical protein ABIR55_14385 [Burkholderiaceae bacterium]
MIRRRRPAKRPPLVPLAAALLVLAIAMGSAAVWVAYGTSSPDLQTDDSPWWPGPGAVPTR